MQKLVELIAGKKTYLVALAAGAIAAYQAYTGQPVPEWVYVILGSLGLGFLRAGVQKSGLPPI